MSDDLSDKEEDPQPPQSSAEDGYETLSRGFLSPRHRRLAQLAAQGVSNSEIARELDYTDSRVSILLRQPPIVEEIRKLQDRIFEATISQRMKAMGDAALNNIEWILTDRTNKVKVSEKADMSKWVVEKLDGKAIQKTDIGENLLSVLLDRLDAKNAPRSVIPADIEITPSLPAPSPATEPPAEADDLQSWISDFSSAVRKD